MTLFPEGARDGPCLLAMMPPPTSPGGTTLGTSPLGWGPGEQWFLFAEEVLSPSCTVEREPHLPPAGEVRTLGNTYVRVTHCPHWGHFFALRLWTRELGCWIFTVLPAPGQRPNPRKANPSEGQWAAPPIPLPHFSACLPSPIPGMHNHT